MKQIWSSQDVVCANNYFQAHLNISEKTNLNEHKDWFSHYARSVDVKKTRSKEKIKDCVIFRMKLKINKRSTALKHLYCSTLKKKQLNQKLTEFYLFFDWQNERARNNRQIWSFQEEVIEVERTRYVRPTWIARCDRRQSDRIEIWISWRKTCVWSRLLIEIDRTERSKRWSMKEDLHRRNRKSDVRSRILWKRTLIDHKESNIRNALQQSKQRCWIHQHHQTFNEERLYNLIKTKQMTETERKIINQWSSIEKDKLFAICKWERKLARVEMMMILHKTLKISILEAHEKAKQLQPEREAFYSLIDQYEK